MLDIKQIRQDPNLVEKKLKTKDSSIVIEPILEADRSLRALKQEIETLQQERNARSLEIGGKQKQGLPVEEDKAAVRLLGEQLSSLQKEETEVQQQYHHLLACLPNLPMDDIPIAPDKTGNVTIKQVGECPTFSFPPKNHVELNETLRLFDFKMTAKTCGSGWPAYRGMGARLEWALISHCMDVQIRRGFEFWLPPVLVRPDALFESGQLPKFKGQFYELDDAEQPLCLIPTAEVVLNGFLSNELLNEESLPIRWAAYSPCFRREAGAAGAGERGLIRVHQFNKVEMFAFTKPEQSKQMFEEMLATAEEILADLELHYRLSLLSTGDMSFAAGKTVDVEVWLPGQQRYYEVSSVSNCTDYQARRSQIRYRGQDGKPTYVHTLNGSGLATSRLLVSLLECNQQADGSVRLPRVLAEKLGTTVLQPSL